MGFSVNITVYLFRNRDQSFFVKKTLGEYLPTLD